MGSEMCIRDRTYDDRLGALKARLAKDQESRIARDQQAIDDFDGRVQREREGVSKRLAQMELKLQEDQASLAELTRVEAERGSESTAVQLGVFPQTEPQVERGR